MKYVWTDWITHVPGQQLPIGTHGIFEFIGTRTNGGEPFQEEVTLMPYHRHDPVWFATDPDGTYVMLLRYKLRSIAAEDGQECERELEAA